MLDDAYRAMLRHFGTFFLVPALVIVPLHLAYAFAFRDVIALGELHEAIGALPAGRDVRGVTSGDITTARLVFWVVVAAELLLVPVFAAVTARALAAESRGRPHGILTYWTTRRETGGAGLPSPGVVAPAAVIALVIALLAGWVTAPLPQAAPDHLAWAVAGLGTATAHCLAAPFLLVPWAWAKGKAGKEPTL